MNTRDYEDEGSLARSSKHQLILVGAGAAVLAILLGTIDTAVLSGLKTAISVSDMIIPIRLTALLTVGVVLLVIGAVASFASALRRGATVQIAAEGPEQGREAVVAEEVDVFNVRSTAAKRVA